MSNYCVGPQSSRRARASLYLAAAISALLLILFVGIHIKSHIFKSRPKQTSRDSLSAELLEAARQGDTGQISTLLNQGADHKDQALLLAAQQGKSEAVKLLLDRGANLEARDSNGGTAVILAAGYPQTAALKILLDHGANGEARDNNHETALINAARSGNADSISVLLSRVTFTAEERKEALFVASESEPLVIEVPASALPRTQVQANPPGPVLSPPDYAGAVRLLLEGSGMSVDVREDDDQETPLTRAAAFGQTRTVRMLLGMGASVHARDQGGDTPLLAAACECAVVDMPDTEESMELLLDSGANIEASDKSGDTPLMRAASWGRTENVKLLLDRGARIDAANGAGDTALTIATGGDISLTQDTVMLLVRRGANVNVTNHGGSTPLILALASPAYGDKTALVRLLLASGADLRATNAQGQTALSLAKQSGSDSVVKLLQSALAKYH